jgi:WD40 repeat protein
LAATSGVRWSALRAELTELRASAGQPPLRALVRLGGHAYSTSSVSEIMNGKRADISLRFVRFFVAACAAYAAGEGNPLPPASTDPAAWRARWQQARLADPEPAGPAEPGEPGEPAQCPYRGLAEFRTEDARWFFGRAAATADLVAGVREAAGQPLLLVAPSGTGKSSLLRAGLLAALDGPHVMLTPTAHPLAELAARLAVPAGELTPARVAGALGGRLLVVDQLEEVFGPDVELAERRAYLAALAAAAALPTPVVLAVRADFYGRCLEHPMLAAALRRPVPLGPLTAAEARAAITGPAEAAGLALEPGLVEVILRDLGVAAGGDGTCPPGVLPLLSHALFTTWQWRDGRTLTLAGYERAGGIGGAVRTTAEDAYGSMRPAEQAAARWLLPRLVHASRDGAVVRRRADRAGLVAEAPDPDAAAAVLDTLARARLVVLDRAGVEIIHETLPAAWPRLRQWIDADRAALLARQQLDGDAADWDAAGRDPAWLYEGGRLAAALAAPAPTGLTAEFLTAARARERDEQAAIRSANRRLRRLVAGLAALLLVAAGATAVAASARATARGQRDTALSQRVAAAATALTGLDPALARQLSLGAYRLSPTAEARGALLSTASAPYATVLTHPDSVYTLAYRPDGRVLATTCRDGRTRLWSLANPRRPTPLGTLPGASPVNAAAYRADGRILATGGWDGTARLTDVSDPAHPTTLAELALPDRVTAVAFSPDGRTLAAASADHTARLWDLADPRRPAPVAVLRHPDAVGALAYSPDGRTLATAGAGIRLWPTDRRRPAGPPATARPTAPGPTAAFPTAALPTAAEAGTVAWSPDGRTLAAGDVDGNLTLWRDRVRVSTVDGGVGAVFAVAFGPAGSLAAVGDRSAAAVWDVRDPAHPVRTAALSGHTNSVTAATFSPDGRTLATGSDDATARLWEVPGPVLAAHPDYVATATAPTGRTLATGGGDGTARLWDLGDPARPTLLSTTDTHAGAVRSLAWRPDGTLLATGAADHTTRLWDVRDRRRPDLRATLTGDDDTVDAVAFSPDGRRLATVGSARTVQLWDVTDPSRPARRGTVAGHTGAVTAVAFSPDGRTLATAAWDRTARLWDVRDPGHPTALAVLTGHTNAVSAVAFSPDGSLLATGGNDRTAMLWRVTDPRHPVRLGTLTGHVNTVAAVAFAPDGGTLAAASWDATITLWSVRGEPQLTATLTGHTGTIRTLGYAPDGHTLTSGAEDGTAHLWETDPARAIARICAGAAPISEPDWDRYFPGIRYRRPCVS